jgi:hypothetical protein
VKKLSALAMLLILMASVTFAVTRQSAHANPPGAPDGQLAFKFNYIAVPEGTNVGCGEGHRVFTEEGAVGHIVWELDTTANRISVQDCETESIDGDPAWIVADQADTYTVFVRILGPMDPTDNWIHICRNIFSVEDPFEGHLDLCELGDVTLTRGGTDRFTFPQKLFAQDAEGELWHLDIGSNFRIAEVRLYEEP